jgi:exodeoxyribonuclease VIII
MSAVIQVVGDAYDLGVLPGMSFEDYRALPGLNWSALKNMRRSPAHYRHELIAPREASAAMRIGSYTHALLLEPSEAAMARFRVWGQRRAGKEWEAFEAEAAASGCDILSAAEERAGFAMASAVLRSRPAAHMLGRADGAHREVVCVWRDASGRPRKARLDAVAPGALIDIKTAANLDHEAFAAAAARQAYHCQLAYYVDAWQACTGETLDAYVVAVESCAPHDVVVYRFPDDAIEAGRRENSRLVDRLARCEASGEWPGREAWIADLAFPVWAMPEDLGITVGGEGF